MKINRNYFIILFVGILNISTGFAVSLPAPLQVVRRITEHQISGADMAGMKIAVNGSSTSLWDGASASGAGWELAYTGTDTWGGVWKFTKNGFGTVNTISFDAFGADAVFDKDWSPNGTENSQTGSFVYRSGPDNVATSFSGPVMIEGASNAVGDIYRYLTFDFTPIGGLALGDSFEFTADTDKVSAIPLPPAMLLFFSGIVGLIGLKRRKL